MALAPPAEAMMPTYHTQARDGSRRDVTKYRLPCWLGPTEAVAGRLLELRKRYALQREEMLGFQREAGAARDAETARFFKQEASDRLRLYRACCLLIPWYCAEYPGDCELRDPWEWPEELHWTCDLVCGIVEA